MGGPLALSEVAALVGGTVEGDGTRVVTGMQSLEAAGPSQLSFLANRRYISAARQTEAGGVLVGPDVDLEGIDCVVVSDPYRAFAQVMQHWHPVVMPEPGVDALVGLTCRWSMVLGWRRLLGWSWPNGGAAHGYRPEPSWVRAR